MAQISMASFGLRAFNANGYPVSGALCYVYEAGTTTPVTTFADKDLTTPQPFPVPANANGGFPEIYVPDGFYKIDLTDSASASLPGFPKDNLTLGFSPVAMLSFATRAQAVAAISSGVLSLLADGTTIIADGLVYQKMDSSHPLYGTDPIPDMPGFFGLEITPYHFGAVGDGVTDDTTPFAWMFAAYELLTRYTTNNGLFRTVFDQSVPWKIDLKPGRYVVNEGWKPSSSAGRIMKMVGDGPTQAVIIMPTDGSGGYLIEQEDRTDGGTPYLQPYHAVHCEGFKLVGGKGLYINREPDAPFVQRGVHVELVDIVGFTECGMASLWADDPRWTLRSVRIETTSPGTKGLYLPRGVANSSFVDVSIFGCTYKLVTARSFQSTSNISGISMFSLAGDDHEADIWFTTIDSAESNDGRGVIISGNRFSSENRDGKPVVLIADMDGVGEEQAQGHVPSASSRRFRDWKFVNNTVSGSGTADSGAGPMILSYTADIGASEIRDNSINVGFTRIIEVQDSPTVNEAVGLQIGPNQFVGGGEPPVFCNIDIGNWVSPNGSEIAGKETPILSHGAQDPNALVVSVTAAGAPHTMGTVTTSNANLIATAPNNEDPFGFANARAVVFQTAAGYVEMLSDPTQLAALGLAVNENYFIEFWHKHLGGLIINEVDCEIVINSSGGNLTRTFSFRPTAKWLPYRVAIPAHTVPTGFRVRWKASPDAWSASSDRFKLARPRAYRANRPTVDAPQFLVPFQKAQLTAASAAASYPSLIYVTDEAGGAVPAFSDGTNWRRVTDRAIVS